MRETMVLSRVAKAALALWLGAATLTAVDASAKDVRKGEWNYISIDTRNTSLVLVAKDGGPLDFRHYGRRIADPSSFHGLSLYRDHHIHQYTRAYATQGGEYVGKPALAVTYPDGSLNTELIYVSHTTSQLSQGVEQTVINLRDSKQPLEVRLVYTAHSDSDVIEAHSEIVNLGKKEVLLRDYFSNTMLFNSDKYLLTRFWGSWSNEFQLENVPLKHGTTTIEEVCGVRTTHKTNPSFMLTLGSETFSETSGDVVAGALEWSGNYSIEFVQDETGTLQVNAGINPYAAEWHLAKGERFITPDMAYTFSTAGAGQASRNLHDWARSSQLYDASAIAPTLLNSWEGAYFFFNTKTLTDMIDDAAAIGLEMFVMDDGWFGNGDYARNSDRSGLGDWQLNTKKIPEGISYIADYAHGKGLKFGIWIEPEMVNPKSKLYETHPEWVVKEDGREIIPARNQYLLDMSNPKVQDFVFDVFDQTMQLGDIDYIKWDCNRHVMNVGSEYLQNQSHFWVAYTQGLYKVLERIRAKYPKVMIQSCSSGGGRIDYGVLKYVNETWTSDDTDAQIRTKMQYGMSLIYPAQIMGSHISAVPNHQTDAVTSIRYRADIAASGRLGVELQPKQMTDQEKAVVSQAIASYKQYRDIVYGGDLYRLSNPYEDHGYALMYVSKDKRRAVVFAYLTDYVTRAYTPQFKLQGLEGSMNYKVTELNQKTSCFWGNGNVFGADYLMGFGLNLNLKKPYTSAVFLLEAE